MNKIGIFLIALTALGLASCTTQQWVTSTETYSKTIGQIGSELALNGYNAVGEINDTENEIFVSSTSFSEDWGYSSELMNDIWNYSTFQYQSADGDQAQIQLKYKEGWDKDNKPFISNVSLVGCSCSNSADYMRICGTGGIADKARYMPLDQNSRLRDPQKTGLTLVGSLIAASLVGAIMATAP